MDKKEISLKNNQSSEEKKDVNSIKHPLDSKSISIEVKDHHDEKIAQIQTVKKMDKMMSLGAKQQIIAKKTFPKIPKFSSSFILASRGIIYASNGEDFAERAAEEAHKLQQQMATELSKIGF